MKMTATRRQILDYLIYHVPLQKSTEDIHSLARANGLKDCSPDRLPFMIYLDCPELDLEFTVVHSTPWFCYRELAKMVWQDVRARKYILNLYKNS